MAMYPNIRTPERYRFYKGMITELSSTSVTILPYDQSTTVSTYFDPQVTEFWKGGLAYTRTVQGQVGDQGTVTAFIDDTGRPLVERLFINQEHVRATVISTSKDTLVVSQADNPRLNDRLLFTFRPDAVTFDNGQIDLSNVNIGQTVAGIGEIMGPNALNVALFEQW